MEIPKNMQEEIVVVQNKLMNAIREHQICMRKLKDDPNNPDICGQKQKIQLHIVSLGRYQKQIVERLRKEVEAHRADNANGSKVFIASPLGLNNNNHITNNNETKHETAVNGLEANPSKEHYEEVIENGDVPSPTQHNDCMKRSPSSVETISGEDDVVEVPIDENSNDKQADIEKEHKIESADLEYFLYGLGLITKSRAMELQNRRAERKRRSTANPQFVYSLLEQPAKRQKRHSYLQTGNAPHTRQTTARMNGPSPPPNKAQATKSTSPPARSVTKSLIPVQKSTTRPNILRNADSKVFINKNKTEDNHTRTSVSSAKSVQSINSKAVHIPGLPSSLTIERIENDSVVCINCRNPGTLTVCENCSSNYHITCHTRSPAPPRTCPKCALMNAGKDIQKNEEVEGEERMEGENKQLRFKKNEKLEEKERERYEQRERNSELRLQVYELEKRSQLLGQSLQLQQRLRQELLGKQEKTQKSIKRLVDFIKLMQLRKNTSSPPPSASTSSLLQPSSSQSPQMTHQMSTNPKTTSFPRSSISTNDKTHLTTPSFSVVNTNDRASPTSKERTRCPTPISCQAPAFNLKSINHTSSSRKSPSQPEIGLFAVTKPTTKVVPHFSTINCRPHPVAALPSRPASSSPTPCSSVVTTVKSRPVPAQSQHSTVSSDRKEFSPSQVTINWIERPSTAESPGPNSHAVNSVSISNQSADPPPKSYCHLTTTSRVAMSSCKSQGLSLDRQKKRHISTIVVADTGRQEATPSSTHCSQAITGPISSPIVHATREALAQMTETIRFCDSNSAVQSTTNWSRTSSQTANQERQQSSSSGTPSRGSSST